MKTQQEIKAFVKHCKDIAVELDERGKSFEFIRIEEFGDVCCIFDYWSDSEYTIDVTPFLNTPISELRAKRAERERLIQEEMDKHEARQARLRLELERKEYERLKAKFETK